jgi:aryl-alcohol dehydrogenase-like predicted oxidoreductase
MEYRHLGRLGLKVSPLCLGTMNFGPQTSEPDSHAIMDRALELGINFFDTANVYGQRKGVGATETIVGNWFAKGDGRRDKVVLATKVYSEMGSWPNESRLSALHIRKACEDSLRRLQTDHLDIYQMHHVYREATWDEVWQAFEKLEVLPACEDYGLGVIPWSPLWRGMLAGVLDADGSKRTRRSSTMVQDELAERRPQVEAYEKFCAELGQPPAEVAIAWLLANPVVTSPIIGPRIPEQLESAMQALDLRLDKATMKRLDEIWPGPGGPAPEAFAW